MYAQMAIALSLVTAISASIALLIVECRYRAAHRNRVLRQLSTAMFRAERYRLRLAAIESLVPEYVNSLGQGGARALTEANTLLTAVQSNFESIRDLIRENTWHSIAVAEDELIQMGNSPLPSGRFCSKASDSVRHPLHRWEHRLDNRLEEIGARIGVTVHKLSHVGVHHRYSRTMSVLQHAGLCFPTPRMRMRFA